MRIKRCDRHVALQKLLSFLQLLYVSSVWCKAGTEGRRRTRRQLIFVQLSRNRGKTFFSFLSPFYRALSSSSSSSSSFLLHLLLLLLLPIPTSPLTPTTNVPKLFPGNIIKRSTKNFVSFRGSPGDRSSSSSSLDSPTLYSRRDQLAFSQIQSLSGSF